MDICFIKTNHAYETAPPLPSLFFRFSGRFFIPGEVFKKQKIPLKI
jgi:hypothetical protein